MRLRTLRFLWLWLAVLCAVPTAVLAQQTTRDSLAAADYAEDFDAFWTFARKNYAYFDQKKTNWNQVRARYRPRAVQAKSMSAFIGHLEDALEELYDHHAHLGVNTAASPRLVPSGADLWAAWRGGQPVITNVRDGSGAARAGLQPGMTIVSIGGRPTKDVVAERLPATLTAPDPDAKAWALRAALAGRHDRPVRLTVRHEGRNETFAFSPAAPDRPAAPLTTRVLDGNVGYIRIHDALDDTSTIAAFDAALNQLRGTRGLVLDLRDTPGGGNTTVARALMSRLVSEERPYQRHELPSEERRYGVRRAWVEHVLPGGPFTYRAPVAVLVGRWTGSMGEGLATGLDGLGRATVVGTPMAGLRGALHERVLPNTGIAVRLPAERLFHIDGTPRASFRPGVLVDPANASRADPTLQRALGFLSKKK